MPTEQEGMASLFDTDLRAGFDRRSSPDRRTVDFVFDAPQAVVRVRFVAKAGDDCLYAQALLEPKVEIKSVRISVRCYPSAFVSDADRHVLTPLRDLKQGERAKLDVAQEWWTLYYDRIYDAGYVAAAHRGVGPCAALWLPGQTERASFTVASYGIDTVFDLKLAMRDFRFVFIDYAGKKNDAAKADLRQRSAPLLQDLTNFAFTDPSVANWSLEQKQAELRQAVASSKADKQTAAQYEQWGRELAAQLKLLRSGAARIISQWERGLPELRLKALLNAI